MDNSRASDAQRIFQALKCMPWPLAYKPAPTTVRRQVRPFPQATLLTRGDAACTPRPWRRNVLTGSRPGLRRGSAQLPFNDLDGSPQGGIEQTPSDSLSTARTGKSRASRHGGRETSGSDRAEGIDRRKHKSATTRAAARGDRRKNSATNETPDGFNEGAYKAHVVERSRSRLFAVNPLFLRPRYAFTAGTGDCSAN